MKKAVIGVMMLGIASLGYSQRISKIEEVELLGVEVAPRNLTYMDKVSEGTISQQVLTLEKMASQYNIKESTLYDERANVFHILFEDVDGSIHASYDRDGRILRTSERFKDILPPRAIRKAIYREYPGWSLKSVLYSVSYDQATDIKKMYKAQLRKGNAKASINLGATGERIN